MSTPSILARVIAEVSQGDVVFPTSTRVALRVREALDDPGCSLQDMVRYVKAEPMIAARVVAMANTVAYNPSGKEVADVPSAVSRLGFKSVQTAAIVVATRQLATAGSKAGNKIAWELWRHTTHVAALSHVIARRVTGIDPESAMFAGIVHEMTGFYILSRSDAYPELLGSDLSESLTNDNEEVERDAVGDSNEAVIGRAVFRSLSIPSVVTEGIENMWKGYMGIPPVTLGDTLLLADQLAPVQSPLVRKKTPQDTPAVSHIDMAVGEETLREILKESSDQVEDLIRALQ